MLYNILKPLHVTIDGEHHDTLRQDYPGCFSYFANFYGTVRWRDTTTPRTDAPVRFAVVRWPSRDGARMDRLTCIRPQWSRPVNRPPVRFPA